MSEKFQISPNYLVSNMFSLTKKRSVICLQRTFKQYSLHKLMKGIEHLEELKNWNYINN